MTRFLVLLITGLFLLVATETFCQEASSQELHSEENSKLVVKYAGKGLNFSTSDSIFNMNLGFRLQFRAFNFDVDPRLPSAYSNYNHPSFIIRRARLKLGGHVFRTWLKFVMQYDFDTNNLIDANFAIEKYKAFNITLGRHKAFYNREWGISSSKQLLVERSIINRTFTIDRQEGFSFWGHIGSKSPVNFNYWASVFTGNGIHADLNDDNKLMYAGRIQWNLIGGDTGLDEADSDIDRNEVPKVSIGFAASTNVSRYTRFSSSGGGNLDLFLAGDAGQYKIDQWAEDFVFKYKGVSILQEYHRKKAEDRVNDLDRTMTGYFAQAGLFPKSIINAIPKQLQFAVRYARLNPDSETANDNREEFTAGINWYFNGFRNKLSADYSHLTMHTLYDDFAANRFRIQWDISF